MLSAAGYSSHSHRVPGPGATRLPEFQTRGTGRGAGVPGTGPVSPGLSHPIPNVQRPVVVWEWGVRERWGMKGPMRNGEHKRVCQDEPTQTPGPSVSSPNQCHTFLQSSCVTTSRARPSPARSAVWGRGCKESWEVTRPCVQGGQVLSPVEKLGGGVGLGEVQGRRANTPPRSKMRFLSCWRFCADREAPALPTARRLEDRHFLMGCLLLINV